MGSVLNSNELRKGTVYLDGNDVFRVIDYRHQKYGRGQATIRVKVKNIHTGSIAEKTYDSGARLPEADTSKRNVQYLYSDNQNANFMDTVNFSQYSVQLSELSNELPFIKEGEQVVALFLGDDLVSIELPKVVELEVTDAPNAVAGDTATGASKKVKLETGLEVDVPLFVKKGEVIRVNTEESAYVGRA